jgi:NADH-quinone oxidoreductase subunit C
MNNLEDLEKKINSELTTKINSTEIKHNQLYIEIDKEDIIDVTLFLKTNQETKFRQLIDVTVVDYPENAQRFKMVYLFLSHEFNQRIILTYLINENEGNSIINKYISSRLIGWKERFLICMGYHFKIIQI